MATATTGAGRHVVSLPDTYINASIHTHINASIPTYINTQIILEHTRWQLTRVAAVTTVTGADGVM